MNCVRRDDLNKTRCPKTVKFIAFNYFYFILFLFYVFFFIIIYYRFGPVALQILLTCCTFCMCLFERIKIGTTLAKHFPIFLMIITQI